MEGPIFLEEKVIHVPITNNPQGSFAIDTRRFEVCRERFGKMWNSKTKGFYMMIPPGGYTKVAHFIFQTEKVLKRKRFSAFANTNLDWIMWIEPTAFWKACRMRRSLFTILVRAGMNYDAAKRNYEQTLFGHSYLKETQKAVMRFLFGFTKYEGPTIESTFTLESKGWVATFSGLDSGYIKSWLVYPGKKKEVTFNTATDLWI